MKESTIKRAKRVEKEVMDQLNVLFGSNFRPTVGKYAPMDIIGEHEGACWLIEVKERDISYYEGWLDTKKVFALAKARKEILAKGEFKEVRVLLVSVLPEYTYVYDLMDIISEGKVRIQTNKVNATTAKGFRNQGEKVDKEQYIIKRDDYMFEILPEGGLKLSPAYESIS